MRIALSSRRRTLYNLVRQANDQSSDWLLAQLKDPQLVADSYRARMTRLSRLACLRILVCRDNSGLPYAQRKHLVRRTHGI